MDELISQDAINKEATEVRALVSMIPRSIATDQEYQEGLEWLVKIVRKRKDIEEFRDAIIKPLSGVLNGYRTRFNELMEPLVWPESQLQEIIKGYRAKRKSQLTQEQQLELEEYEKRVKLAEEAGTDVAEPPRVVQGLGKLMQTRTGRVQFNTVNQYSITDPDLVPDEYWAIDTAKVGAAVRAGLQVPGVKAWPTEVIQVKKR